MRPVLLLLAFTLAAGTVRAEEFYKWKDENGTWNYSTVAPKDKPATVVNVSTGASDSRAVETMGSDGSPAPAPSDAKAPPPATLPVGDAASALAKQQETQNANCTRARGNVATLEANPKVQMDRDGKGERALTDEEHLEELQKARKQVEVFCGNR